jgi:PTH1 family peptidyl-tRNA hydrolase
MKLIVGIGNPDPEYLDTRHNVGWMFLDWLNKKYKGTGDEVEIDGAPVKLFKPQHYVNKSGPEVLKAKKMAKAKNEDIIVVQDDLDIPFGMCKLSFDKNSGGHRGIESIISSLKTKKFYRIRIGLGVSALNKARAQSAHQRDEWVRDFVLKKFTPTQQEQLKEVFAACQVRLLHALKS